MVTPSPRLDGLIFVVTGGTDGIGAATALLAAERGATVVVSGRSAEKGAKVVADIDAKGGSKGLFIKADITSPEEIQAMFAKIVAQFGRVDVFFNNAGWEGSGESAFEYPVEQLRKLYDTNVLGPTVAMQEAVKAMKKDDDKTRTKVIINTSSIVAGLPTHNVHSIGWYACTKAAMDSMTRVAAGSLAPDGIKVYSVNPGAVLTRMAQGAIEMDQMKKLGIDSMDKFAGFNCIGPEKMRMILPEEIGKVVLNMAAGTTRWKPGDCVYVGPGATTISMGKLYEEIYAESMESWMKSVGDIREGYNESKDLPEPL